MRRGLKIAGIVLGVIILALIALPFGINVNSFRPKLEAELSTALGREVKVGNLDLSLFGGRVSAEDLSVADDPAFSSNAFIRAKSLKVGVELLPLIFSKALHITDLTLEKPEITLMRADSGKWNFSSLGGTSSSEPAPASANSSATANLAVKKLDIKEGQVKIGRASSPKIHVYDNVNIGVRDFSFTAEFPFTFSANFPGGGELKVDGKLGPINSTDTSLTPVEAQLHVKRLDLAASGFGDLFPGLSGIADFDSAAVSDGQLLRTNGTLHAEKLKLVQNGSPAGRPVELKYAVEHQLQSVGGTLTQGDISMGRALAQLTGAYEAQGPAMLLTMKLNAQAMPVNDLEAMLPALGVVLPAGSSLNGGTLSANLTINGPADGPVIAGPIRLSNSRLARFDLGSKMSAVSKLSGSASSTDTSIQNFSTDARIAPGGIRGDNVNLTVPALGTLTGNGTISPGGALEFKMTANLTGAIASQLTKLAGLGDKGTAVAFFIRGTTSNPTFVPDVGGTLKGQLGNQLGQKLGAKLTSSMQSKAGVKAPTAQTRNLSPQSQPEKKSVFGKIGGFFHKKKNPNDAQQSTSKK
jgi:AsmA protein